VEAVEAIVTPLSEGVRHCVYLRKGRRLGGAKRNPTPSR
jgi:hypothetical protein